MQSSAIMNEIQSEAIIYHLGLITTLETGKYNKSVNVPLCIKHTRIVFIFQLIFLYFYMGNIVP